MNRYQKYKDSGIAWIGKIPEWWSVNRHKQVMRKIKHIKEVYDNENIISLSKKGVIIRDLDAGGKMPTSFNGYQKVYSGNLLLCLFDIDVTPRCIGLIKNDGLSSPAYSQFKLSKRAYAPYYDYLLRYMDDEKTLLHLSKNLRNSLTEDDFSQIDTIVPPLSEQEAIAEFLDRKCGEIDELIGLQEKMIAELGQYKQSVITEAITRGLNHDAPLKDSGIEWIGKIPQHWGMGRLKNIISEKLQYGANENGIVYNELLPRYVRITDISDNLLKNNIEKQSLSEDIAKEYILKDNDILFARSGGTVGKTFMYKSIYGRCAFAGYLIRATINNANAPQYVYYYTQSYSYNEWKNRIFIQATIQNIGADKYSIMEIMIPPLVEQQAIANYLDHKCKEMDELTEIKKQKIEQLKEYKKSVIYEYVTGKKRVKY